MKFVAGVVGSKFAGSVVAGWIGVEFVAGVVVWGLWLAGVEFTGLANLVS